MPNPKYMDQQPEIHWNMRTILVDWLVQVHSRFRLLPETLYLTVNIIDRFLSIKLVSIAKLQLVGIASLFVACKYEEERVPAVADLVYMVDGAYDSEEILKAERFLLGLLEFNLYYPGPMNFLRRISKADNYDVNDRTLAKYLIEATLVDERFLAWMPSMVAAAAMYLARKVLTNGDWTPAFIQQSGYQEHELMDCARTMLDCVAHPAKHAATYEKYADQRFLSASAFMAEYLKKVGYVPSSASADAAAETEMAQ
ncbi:G2/mitotic-specific cyclin [Quaeritorhiza haematococci]|nr:G2/mitotic-specific cyclin [Quaeritorhiza haematococci]